MASGLTDYAKGEALSALLPNGTDVYVGLFFTVPTADDGTGGVEASGSGYSRTAWQFWTDDSSGDVVYRVNNGAVDLFECTADLDDVNGWGIWDAAAAGNLLAFGPILDVSGDPVVDKTFASGETPSFPDGELKVGVD